MNNSTPKSNRIQIALFGRTNVGKSSFLNYIIGQDISITSEIAGTTTDVVEKPMELLPLGPVLFLDTAGLGDRTALSEKRLAKTAKVYERSDVILLVVEAGVWTEYEQAVVDQARDQVIPLAVIINKCDVATPDEKFLAVVGAAAGGVVLCNSLDTAAREQARADLKQVLRAIVPPDLLADPVLISDLVAPGQTAVLVVPIDLEAPKGRLILPQVQTIRDILDSDAVAVIAKDRELSAVIANLKTRPAIVVCDSQAVLKVAADTPTDIPMTTFSILFSRMKGDIVTLAAGAAQLDHLNPESRVLIAEACTHHPIGDDIGRVKIPRWLRQYLGFAPRVETFAGCEYPANLADYDLVIHCGACMFNRRQMLTRLEQSRQRAVPITNYGICISVLQGVVERTLAPFPRALLAYHDAKRGRG